MGSAAATAAALARRGPRSAKTFDSIRKHPGCIGLRERALFECLIQCRRQAQSAVTLGGVGRPRASNTKAAGAGGSAVCTARASPRHGVDVAARGGPMWRPMNSDVLSKV
jgi:hypothetical protein